MIDRYNRIQIGRAILAVFGGLLCSWLAYLFFRYVPPWVARQFGHPISPLAATTIGILGLAVAFFSGYRTWKGRGGLYGYHESTLYHDLGGDTAGAVVVDFYAHRVTGPAYLLSQVFLAGPLLLFRAATHVNSLLPSSCDLEERLESTLGLIRSANKWQSLNEYPDARTEVLYLAQMRLIDFSAYKGTPRFRARGESMKDSGRRSLGPPQGFGGGAALAEETEV